jgi:HlyD family secretion protein
MLLVPALTLAGCSSKPAKEQAPVATVQAEQAQTGAITDQIEADALLAPVAQAAIQSKITAPIKQFLVQRGAHVRAGQLVAVLENADLAAAALDNQGALKSAEGTYTQATQGQIPQEVTQAKLGVAEAKATAVLNQSILAARTRLLAEGAISGREVDIARATAMQSQAALDIAQQKYNALASVVQRASISAAQGQLTSAEGRAMGAQAQLNYTRIHTPISGYVTDRPLFVGETAAPGTPILTVMDTSTMIAKLHIAQQQAQQLKTGADATLTVPGIDHPVPAKVSLVSPALDPGSSTVEVWLKVANPGNTLKPGTTVHATITGETIEKALLIPTEAVQRSPEGTGKAVMVIAPDGAAHSHNITVGIQTKESTQILSGVNAGDSVITGGGYGLDDGTKVRVGPAPAEKTDAGDKDAAPDAATPSTPSAGAKD